VCTFFIALTEKVKINIYSDLDAPPTHPSSVYDLIANVTHESTAGTTRDKESTVYKVHLRAGSGGGEGEEWFQIQDLIVEKTRKEMIFLGETVLQVGLPDLVMRS
jgi:U4/U6.U5 tri-snRNP-associated protein 2